MVSDPDVLIRCDGTVWTFNPISERAKQWFDENVQSESWQWLGSSLVVDHRWAADLIRGIIDARLKIG